MVGPDSWLNTASHSSEWKEVTQEDMIRVSESMKQAALIWWQIRGDQQKNAQYALFLEFLFNEVKNDKLWELMIDVCSKPDGTWFNTTLSIQELILFFAPFFEHKFHELGLQHVFQHEVPWVHPMSLDNYAMYFKDMRSYYPLMWQLDASIVAETIVTMISHFWYASRDAEKRKEVVHGVVSTLG